MTYFKYEGTIMIFLCFSVKDRTDIINPLYHYLQNFGLNLWYDRRNIFLGDNRQYTNIELGANNRSIKYAIVVYSDNFSNGNICLDELDILIERYIRNEIHIFPLFYKTIPDETNKRLKLLKQLVYKSFNNYKDFFAIALHIISKITQDELDSIDIKYKTIKEIIINYENKTDKIYQFILIYTNISTTNYDMRLTALFYIYNYIVFNNKKNYMHFKTMNYMFYHHNRHKLIDEKRQLQVMENIVVYEFFKNL